MLSPLLATVVRLRRGLASRARRAWWAALGVRFGGHVFLGKISIPRQWADITLAAGVALDDGVVLLCSGPARPGKLQLGARTYVNRGTIFDASAELLVGADCLFGPGVYVTDHDHGWQPGQPPAAAPLLEAPTRLGDRVWVGAGAKILKGVTVGDDAVIAAGAVVTRSVAPGTRVAGVPARPLPPSAPAPR